MTKNHKTLFYYFLFLFSFLIQNFLGFFVFSSVHLKFNFVWPISIVRQFRHSSAFKPKLNMCIIKLYQFIINVRFHFVWPLSVIWQFRHGSAFKPKLNMCIIKLHQFIFIFNEIRKKIKQYHSEVVFVL